MDDKYKSFSTDNKLYMLFIAIMIGVLFLFQHLISGAIFLAVYLILIVYNIVNERRKEIKWRNFIEEFSIQLDSATQNTLVKNPFPIVITSEDGSILWYNQKFVKIISIHDILGRNITEINSNILISDISEIKKEFRFLSVEGKFYDAYVNKIDTVQNGDIIENVYIFYFYDVTDKYSLIRESVEKREAVMLIEVDNFDEVIRRVEEEKKPLLQAEVEKNIYSYANSLKSFCKKYENNKFLLTIQNKYLKEEADKKFDILDQIRDINMGNTLGITLSIGVGDLGETPAENYNFAQQAMELALGRGGDQAVVKSQNKLDFYGGKTKEVQKRTKVRARVIAHALLNIINESSSVFIMGHKSSDIDCLGSAVGLNRACRLLSKLCFIVMENENGSVYPLMEKLKKDENYQDIIINSSTALKLLDEKSLLILVDVNSDEYVQSIDLLRNSERYVVIDHHRRSRNFIEGALLTYVEVYSSSTSELVTEIFQYMLENPKLSPIEAEALLAGIVVDTKHFTFKTGVRTFEAASFLRKQGADTVEVKRLFSNDLDSYLDRYEIMKTAVIKNNIAIAKSPDAINDNVIASQAADELINVTGILASFVLYRVENDILISGRSSGDVNVQLILEELGGGGHLTMAGARLKGLNMEEAFLKLEAAIDNYFKESEE
ncbi:MAG: DHH family phosphoesterase [Bacillota bacterium]|nr:DHH family phosphoesterase [Bacillota bacterium]